ncbi:adenylyl cyclase, partial [Trypanosoma grayi]|uniref:adenylyl cyclase n=1 Tax=Trypanosoma grayi TaxID=71804 RepID=UPI0004F4647A
MYLRGVGFGEMEYAHAVRVLSRMGYTLSGVFTVESSVAGSAEDAAFSAAWETFADTRPRAVIVFGAPGRDTAKFVEKMLTDQRTASAYLLAPSALQNILVPVWRAAVSRGVPFIRGHVTTTGTTPLATNTRFSAIKRFQSVLRDYLTNSGQRDYTDRNHFLNNDLEGELMVAGWIIGEVLSQALDSRVWLKNRETFRRSLFTQRRYLIQDIVIGDFGGECVGSAASQGAICECNQGGRTVFMKRFVENFRSQVVPKGRVTFPTSECYGSAYQLQSPLNAIAAMMHSIVVVPEARESFSNGIFAATGEAQLKTIHEFSVRFLNSTTDDAGMALNQEI